jgi:hypothetical protein
MQTLIEQKKDNQKISKIIDRVLRQVFGQEATVLIYHHLDRYYSLKPSEITEKIDLFAKGLEEFLRSGADVIEQKILDDIYSSSDLLRRVDPEKMQEESDFVSQIKMLAHRA